MNHSFEDVLILKFNCIYLKEKEWSTLIQNQLENGSTAQISCLAQVLLSEKGAETRKKYTSNGETWKMNKNNNIRFN